jgi:hypothetical protein
VFSIPNSAMVVAESYALEWSSFREYDRTRLINYVGWFGLNHANTEIGLFLFLYRAFFYVHGRPTNELILFKVYSLSYMLLHVWASSALSSGSLHVFTELLVLSESSSIKFCTVDGGVF